MTSVADSVEGASDRSARGRPKDVDSADTRARVLAAARRIFAAKGYAATTNRDIAAEAGLTAAALYHYAESKVGLYAAVYDEVQDIVYRAFDAAVAEADDLAGRFCAVLDQAVVLNGADWSLSGFINVVGVDISRHPELDEPLAAARGRTGSFLRGLVRDAVDRGELADTVDVRAVEDMLNVVLTGLARLSNLTGDPDRHAAAVAATKRLIRGTLLR